MEVDGQLLLAPIGDVMNAALPPGLKLSSQSVLVLDRGVIPNETELSDSLFLLYEALKSNEKLTLDEVKLFLKSKIQCLWFKRP